MKNNNVKYSVSALFTYFGSYKSTMLIIKQMKYMKIMNFSFALLLLLCFSACIQKSRELNSGVIRLDNIFKGSEIPSSIIKQEKVILLETTKESLIGKIDEIEIFNNRIYILDKMQKSIICFDMLGKYLFRIKSIGKGPGEYMAINHFTINTRTNEIICLGVYKYIYFTTDGQYVKEKKAKMHYSSIFYYNHHYFLMAAKRSEAWQKRGNNFIIKDENLKTIKEFLNTNGYEIVRPRNMLYVKDNDLIMNPIKVIDSRSVGFKVTCPDVNTVFKIDTSLNYVPKYYFDYGKDNPKFDSDGNLTSGVKLFSSILETDTHMFFQHTSKKSKYIYFTVYDKNSKKYYSGNKFDNGRIVSLGFFTTTQNQFVQIIDVAQIAGSVKKPRKSNENILNVKYEDNPVLHFVEFKPL